MFTINKYKQKALYINIPLIKHSNIIMLKSYLKQIDIGLILNNKYKILNKISRGSYGTVFKVENIINKNL